MSRGARDCGLVNNITFINISQFSLVENTRVFLLPYWCKRRITIGTSYLKGTLSKIGTFKIDKYIRTSHLQTCHWKHLFQSNLVLCVLPAIIAHCSCLCTCTQAFNAITSWGPIWTCCYFLKIAYPGSAVFHLRAFPLCNVIAVYWNTEVYSWKSSKDDILLAVRPYVLEVDCVLFCVWKGTVNKLRGFLEFIILLYPFWLVSQLLLVKSKTKFPQSVTTLRVNHWEK